MEDLNSILASGEIPNIYNKDEKKNAQNGVRKDCKREYDEKKIKWIENDEILWNFFMKRVKIGTHVAFCVSPIGEQFRDYVRMYPALVNNTTIIWFMQWPDEALIEVSKHFLTKGFNETQIIQESEILPISQIFS